MTELIKVTYHNDRPAVSARALHEFLDVKTAYKDWFPRMCEYGFTEGQDFCSFLSESTGGRPAQDAILTIDMAKELCMLQRNEKGKEARQYFIQLEKDWNSPEKVMARALQIADRKINCLELENAKQAQLLSEYEPKVQYMDKILESRGTLATKQIAADYGLTAQQLNAILHEAGIQYKVNKQWLLYRKHMGLGYTKSITIPITRADGTPDTTMHTQWTQKGRLMIHNLLESKGIIAEMDKPAHETPPQ